MLFCRIAAAAPLTLEKASATISTNLESESGFVDILHNPRLTGVQVGAGQIHNMLCQNDELEVTKLYIVVPALDRERSCGYSVH